MMNMIKFLAVIAIYVAGLLAGAAAPANAAQVKGKAALGAVQPAKAVDLKGMTDAQIEALPDSTLIDLGGGKTKTKGQLLAEGKKKAEEEMAKSESLKGGDKSEFEAKVREFNAQQKAKLDSANAPILAKVKEVERAAALERELDGLYKEIRQLNDKYKTASPSEKARIDKRAGEIGAILSRKGVQQK